jgi:hypothetical protein
MKSDAGWPTAGLLRQAIFLLTAGGGALAVVSALLWRWGTAAMPRVIRPLVLIGRASLSHYVLHIVIAYSLLRLQYPDEDWAPRPGLWAMLAYLAIGVPLTAFWFRHHTQGPLEMLWARASRRPGPAPSGGDQASSPGVEVIRTAGTASLHAMRSFAPGEIVSPLEGDPVSQPTRFTIQVGTDAHLDPVSERTSPWGYTNHSCDANLAIDVPRRVIVGPAPDRRRGRALLRLPYDRVGHERAVRMSLCQPSMRQRRAGLCAPAARTAAGPARSRGTAHSGAARRPGSAPPPASLRFGASLGIETKMTPPLSTG